MCMLSMPVLYLVKKCIGCQQAVILRIGYAPNKAREGEM